MLKTNRRTFGEWLRWRREHEDLTQWVLADRANCSFSTICKLEQGGRRPSRQMALRLMEVLHVPLEERAALLDLARSRPGINEAGTSASTSASRKATSAASALQGSSNTSSRNSDLPALRNQFIGREKEMAAVRALLTRDTVRLVTLLGSPGTGKTRLALRVSSDLKGHFAAGVSYVFLAPLAGHEMVFSAIARAVGLSAPSTLSPMEALKAYLADKDLLLVLDNFEHLMPAAEQLGALLDSCSHLKLLVTSRSALDIYGEHLFIVPGMAVPDPDAELNPQNALSYAAVALFEQRARAVDGTFALTQENTPLVAEICRRLDGLPLAIELAAARSKVLTPGEILSRLSGTLDLLVTGPSDLPPRQRSLRGAVNWSYDLLDENERRLLRWMSVFAGDATLDAIESICDRVVEDSHPSSTSVLDLVTSLFGKSLVRRLETSGGEARYLLLWTIREYAQERLDASNEGELAREQHAAYYAGLVEKAAPHLLTGDRDPWLRRLDADHAQIVEALAWCLARPDHVETGLRMAGALEWYWYYRGQFNDGKCWLGDLLAAADAAGLPRANIHRARALSALGKFSLFYYDYDTLQTSLAEAVEVWRALGDKEGLAYALSNLGAGVAHGHASTEGKPRVPGNDQGFVEEAIDLYKVSGNQWGVAYALNWLADIHEVGSGWDIAQNLYERSLRIYQEIGDSRGGASNLPSLGHLALRRKDYAAARAYYRDALAIYGSVDDKWHIAAALRGLGDVEFSEGRLKLAASHYEESLSLYKSLGDRLRVAGLLRSLGYVALQREHYPAASVYFWESLVICQDIDHPIHVLLCVAAFAALAAALGRPATAAELSGLVEASREQFTAVMAVLELDLYERNIARVRSILGDTAFLAARTKGRTLTLAQAIEQCFALGVR